MAALGLQRIKKIPPLQYLSNISKTIHLPSFLHDNAQQSCRVKQVYANSRMPVGTQVFSHLQTVLQTSKYSPSCF